MDYTNFRPGQRLYICEGSPWKKALDEYYSGSELEDCWRVDRTYRTGDLLLTYVRTSPRMLLSLEVLDHDSNGTVGQKIVVDHSKTVTFRQGILKDVVTRDARVKIKRDEYYDGPKARVILIELSKQVSLNLPWLTPARWEAGI